MFSDTTSRALRAALLAALLPTFAHAGSPAPATDKVAAKLVLMAVGATNLDSAFVTAQAMPGQGGKLLADLATLGLEFGQLKAEQPPNPNSEWTMGWPAIVTGRLPLTSVPKLAALASLELIWMSEVFHAAKPLGPQGAFVSHGDVEMHANTARSRYRVNGAGVKVGVLSNAYDCQFRSRDNSQGANVISNFFLAADLVAGRDLPPKVEILADLNHYKKPYPLDMPECDNVFTNMNEGRAMLEVVHDIAPGAALAFRTSARGLADYAKGIRELAAAGAKVIVDDTTYLEEPVWQDGGPVADAVGYVRQHGVTYIAAAGNYGRKTYEAPFRPTGVRRTLGGKSVELHNFSPVPGQVDTCQNITLHELGRLALALHWDQPYASIGGGKGADTDMDIFLMDKDCKNVLVSPTAAGAGVPAMGVADNRGGDPVESFVADIKGQPWTNNMGEPILFMPINSPIDGGNGRGYDLSGGKDRGYITGEWNTSMKDVFLMGIMVGRASGPAPTRLRISYAVPNLKTKISNAALFGSFAGNSRYDDIFEYVGGGPDLFGHANSPGVVTVGAAQARYLRYVNDWLTSTPLTDTGGHPVQPFSALGGTDILFDRHGVRLPQPTHRSKPDIAGVDGVDSRSAGTECTVSPVGGSGIMIQHDVCSYYGTSAAAAHVAGLVALARQAAPDATPARIARALRLSASPLADNILNAAQRSASLPLTPPGFNAATGYGLADGAGLVAKLLGRNLAVDFGTAGLWLYKNGGIWTKLHDGATRQFVAADIDGDGTSDLAASFANAGGLWVSMNGKAWMKLNDLTPVSMTAADVDGNGKADLAVNFGLGQGLWLWLDNQSWVKLNDVAPASVTAADIDGNGQMDLAVNFGKGLGLSLWLDNKNWVKLHDLPPASVTAADVDGDGKADLAIDFGAGHGLSLWLDNRVWVKVHNQSPLLLVAADVDGNGQADLVAKLPNAAGLWLWRNAKNWTKLSTSPPKSVTAADVDGDGKTDLAVSFSSSSGLWLWLDNKSWVKLRGTSPLSVSAADVDGDGKADLAVGEANGLSLWLDNKNWGTLNKLQARQVVALPQ